MSQQYEMTKLAGLLGASVGDEKALEAVREAARQLGIRDANVTLTQALEILERVAETPGIVGVTARFAKSRLHLAKR
jgi:hypothetical protein